MLDKVRGEPLRASRVAAHNQTPSKRGNFKRRCHTQQLEKRTARTAASKQDDICRSFKKGFYVPFPKNDDARFWRPTEKSGFPISCEALGEVDRFRGLRTNLPTDTPSHRDARTHLTTLI